MLRPRRALHLGLCFGLGLGLAPTLRPAHARSCVDAPFWKLERAAIDGDGEIEAERGYWEPEMWLTQRGEDGASTHFNQGEGVRLRRLP